ncbi:nuclear receptor-binding factor 2 isoform X2 [Procambarus clarkii]|uniref:nuclear receptor-binding factor 2 isoform X2 n=1 Tax=Procambarus clarkii TaxID=6728 RepID=UPI001E6784EE|nr:nuclear receptor-binding factor 2-like isoform X2 [Procambarus clarkii]
MSHHRSYSCHKYGLAVVGMDNSPLNQAHREQRRAESCQRGGRLEEAAEYHGQAAKLLTKALALTVTPLARQSITLQHGYHIRQQELLRNTEKFDSLLSLLLPEENDTSGGGQTESKCKQSPQEKEGELACDMKETLNAREITVKTLDVRGTKCSEKVTQTETAKRGESSIGIKKEKDVLVIVEELRTLRDHQADLISQLMTELSFREKENTLLKNQVCELQTKCEQYESERRRMRAMADSSCSPFVFSPLSELSPDPPGVPDLAPLEMPPLDFMENFEQDS